MNTRIWTSALLLLLALTATAQRRRAAARQPVPTPEQQAHQAKVERMTQNTARIMFIDSTVVDKADFLSHYHLSPEAGRIERYQDYFKTNRQPNGFVNLNEIGNKCYLSQENNEGRINLYYSETIANKWTRPTRLRGINDNRQFQRVNYPYMMGDGQTLYFAADGEEGLGGYDIYVTRYDPESQRYLQPTNIGMPFNSEANDYMYVIDEYNALGWFATDRNQPEGKVCIYTFIPSEGRRGYSPEEYTPEQISQFARLASIAATCDDQQALQQAIARLRIASLRSKQLTAGKELSFIVNDDITYTHLSDFKEPANAKRYQQLVELQARYHALRTVLDRSRNYYATASAEEREELRPEILASEQKQHELFLEVSSLEKTIRNAEILYITKNK